MLRSLLVVALLLSACAQEATPEAVSLKYSRALYASDLGQAYRLIATEDHRVKDEETFRREGGAVAGFALEVARQLASFIEAARVETKINGDRAAVTLRIRLPDANAPELSALIAGWDEGRLNALSRKEQEEISQKLGRLHRSGQLPMLEGEETFELVRERAGWRVVLNWAAGVHIRFLAAAPPALPLALSLTPEETVVVPGGRVHVTLRAANHSARDIVARVTHRIEPKSQADSLALLRCPLLLPVTLRAGETEEFRSEYLLLKDARHTAKQLQVTYEFAPLK